jgi:7-carboxy-7-deazaguanine synthase
MDKFSDIYPINEYFQSIQGEGNFAGANSLFIRFHFCNLTCTWCDTKYTWLGDHKKSQLLNANDIQKLIAESSSNHIIFTGGEPSLYRLDKLVIPGKQYHVETNGTFIPTEPATLNFKDVEISREGMDEEIIKHFNWVVSPKLSNARQKLNEQSLAWWVAKPFSIFKFVVRNTTDLDEVAEVVERFNINKLKVYIGLEGQTLASQLQPALVDEIISRGYNFSPRLHVMLWGTVRGK